VEDPQLARGDHVGHRRLAEKDGHLTEEIALAEPGALLAVDLDSDLAIEDHVEARAGEALPQDALAGGIRLLGHLVRHLLDLRPR
jgi:hypothetical protein